MTQPEQDRVLLDVARAVLALASGEPGAFRPSSILMPRPRAREPRHGRDLQFTQLPAAGQQAVIDFLRSP